MIFGCPNCGTDCPVPDEKIRGRILKVRCKHCRHIFYIKDPALSEPVTEATQAPPPPEAEERWFYALKSQSMGPVSVQTMRRLIETAQVISSTLVWQEGMDNWKPLVEVPELVAIMKSIASPRPEAVMSRISEKSQEDIFDFDAQISEDRVELEEEEEERRIIRELEEEEQRKQQEREQKERQAEEARIAAEKEKAEKARKAEEAHSKHLPPEKGRGLHRRSVSIPAYHPADSMESAKPARELAGSKKKEKKQSRQIEAVKTHEVNHEDEVKRRQANEQELEDSFNHFEEQRRIQAERHINIGEFQHEPEKSQAPTERKTGFAAAVEAPKRRMSVMMPAETPPPPPEAETTKKNGNRVKTVLFSLALILVGFGAALALGVFNKPTGNWNEKSQSDENLFLPQGTNAENPQPVKIQQNAINTPQPHNPSEGVAAPEQASAPAEAPVKGEQKHSDDTTGQQTVGSASQGNSQNEIQPSASEKQDDGRLPMAKLDMPSEPDASNLGLPETLSQQEITKVVNRNIERIQFCYDTQLRQNPNLAGKVVVNFTIIGEGRISSVKIMTSQFRGTYLESCVDKTMKTWRFPKFRGEPIEVDYPFIFTSF